MSPSQLLICTVAVVLGVEARIAQAQSPGGHSAAANHGSGPRPATKRRDDPGLSLVHISPSTLGLNSTSSSGTDNSLALQGFDLRSLIARVASVSAARIDLPASLDLTARYDVSLNLPVPANEATMNALILQAIEEHFHLVATRASRTTDVYVLSALGTPPAAFRAAPPPANQDSVVTDASVSFRIATDPGKPPTIARAGLGDVDGISIRAANLDGFCQTLEGVLDRPVVNETDLRGIFNFNFSATSDNQNDFLDQLRSKMNLVIERSSRTVEFLVFRSAGSETPTGAEALFLP